MSSDLTKSIETLTGSFEQFKEANDKRLKAIESKGYAPADLTEKVAKMEADLITQTTKADQLTAALNRSPGATQESKEEKLEKAYKQYGTDLKDGKMFQKAIAIGTNDTGGYAVESIIESDMARVLRTASPIRQLAMVVTQRAGTSAFVKLVAQNDAQSDNTGENASARSDTNSGTMQKVSIPTNTIEAEVVITPEAIEDTVIDPQAWLFQDVVEQFARQEGSQFVVGSGSSNTALGFAGSGYTRSTTPTWGDVTKLVATGSSGSNVVITMDDIISLTFETLDPKYIVNAQYASNATTFGTILKLKDSQGRYLADISSAVDLRNAAVVNANGSVTSVWTCLGKQWNIVPDMVNNEVFFADWKNYYYIVDRVGLTSVVDIYSKKPNTEFYFRKRTGGGIMDSNAGAVLALS